MSAPNDPNLPPPEFALSLSPAGSASNRLLAKPPSPRAAEAVAQGVKEVTARDGRESPERPEREARREAPGGFGALARKILGHEPTAPELEELLRVRDALGLRDNDALWLVLLVLHHQRREFEQSIDRRLAETQQAADALVETARARFLEQFPAALKVAARRVTVKAMDYSGPVGLTSLIAGLALLIAGLVSAGWLAYDLGERAGYERGVLAERAEATSAPKQPASPAKGR